MARPFYSESEIEVAYSKRNPDATSYPDLTEAKKKEIRFFFETGGLVANHYGQVGKFSAFNKMKAFSEALPSVDDEVDTDDDEDAEPAEVNHSKTFSGNEEALKERIEKLRLRWEDGDPKVLNDLIRELVPFANTTARKSFTAHNSSKGGAVGGAIDMSRVPDGAFEEIAQDALRSFAHDIEKHHDAVKAGEVDEDGQPVKEKWRPGMNMLAVLTLHIRNKAMNAVKKLGTQKRGSGAEPISIDQDDDEDSETRSGIHDLKDPDEDVASANVKRDHFSYMKDQLKTLMRELKRSSDYRKEGELLNAMLTAHIDLSGSDVEDVRELAHNLGWKRNEVRMRQDRLRKYAKRFMANNPEFKAALRRAQLEGRITESVEGYLVYRMLLEGLELPVHEKKESVAARTISKFTRALKRT